MVTFILSAMPTIRHSYSGRSQKGNVVAATKMALNDPCFLVWTSSFLWVGVSVTRSSGKSLPRLGHLEMRFCSGVLSMVYPFILLPLREASCHTVSCLIEQGTEASNQQSHEWPGHGSHLLKPLGNCRASQHPHCGLWETRHHTTANHSGLLTHRNHEIINLYCLKLVIWGKCIMEQSIANTGKIIIPCNNWNRTWKLQPEA